MAVETYNSIAGRKPATHILMVRLGVYRRKPSSSKPEAQAEGNRVLIQEPYSLGSRLGLPGMQFRRA